MADPPEVTAKGTGIRSSCEFIAQRYGTATLASIVSTLPADLRNVWPNPLSSVWYPARFYGALWTSLARDVVGADRGEQSRVFHELGRYVADDNLSTVYRVLISIAWPDTLLGMTPSLWATYFDGVQVEVERDPGVKGGRVIVAGLADVPYIGPVAAGWLTLAYEKAGARVVEVVEKNWMEGREASDRLVFEVQWG
jgi:hypothetical protein